MTSEHPHASLSLNLQRLQLISYGYQESAALPLNEVSLNVRDLLQRLLSESSQSLVFRFKM